MIILSIINSNVRGFVCSAMSSLIVSVFILCTQILSISETTKLVTRIRLKWKYATWFKEVSIFWMSNLHSFENYFIILIQYHCTQLFYNLHLEKDEKCISNILKDVDKGIRSCPCEVDCDETGYEVKTSSYLWPSPKYEVWCIIAQRHIIYSRVYQWFQVNKK